MRFHILWFFLIFLYQNIGQLEYSVILLEVFLDFCDGLSSREIPKNDLKGKLKQFQLKKLKQIRWFDTPVVALTADVISGMKEQYLSAGFNDYLAKTIKKLELNIIKEKNLRK